MRRRFAARSARPPLVRTLGLVAIAAVVLLLPTFALVLLPGDTGACLCQSPQPQGDSLTVVALLDVSHGLALSVGPFVLTVGCRAEAVNSGALRPCGCPFAVASEGRPPPPSA